MRCINTKKPLDYFSHEEPVNGLLPTQPSPSNHNIYSLLTACSDERVLLYYPRQAEGERGATVAGRIFSPFHAMAV